ncbi:MAG: hypothetical protein ACRCVT_14730, partial [Leadbetterella sp.]
IDRTSFPLFHKFIGCDEFKKSMSGVMTALSEFKISSLQNLPQSLGNIALESYKNVVASATKQALCLGGVGNRQECNLERYKAGRLVFDIGSNFIPFGAMAKVGKFGKIPKLIVTNIDNGLAVVNKGLKPFIDPITNAISLAAKKSKVIVPAALIGASVLAYIPNPVKIGGEMVMKSTDKIIEFSLKPLTQNINAKAVFDDVVGAVDNLGNDAILAFKKNSDVLTDQSAFNKIDEFLAPSNSNKLELVESIDNVKVYGKYYDPGTRKSIVFEKKGKIEVQEVKPQFRNPADADSPQSISVFKSVDNSVGDVILSTTTSSVDNPLLRGVFRESIRRRPPRDPGEDPDDEKDCKPCKTSSAKVIMEQVCARAKLANAYSSTSGIVSSLNKICAQNANPGAIGTQLLTYSSKEIYDFLMDIKDATVPSCESNNPLRSSATQVLSANVGSLDVTDITIWKMLYDKSELESKGSRRNWENIQNLKALYTYQNNKWATNFQVKTQDFLKRYVTTNSIFNGYGFGCLHEEVQNLTDFMTKYQTDAIAPQRGVGKHVNNVFEDVFNGSYETNDDEEQLSYGVGTYTGALYEIYVSLYQTNTLTPLTKFDDIFEIGTTDNRYDILYEPGGVKHYIECKNLGATSAHSIASKDPFVQQFKAYMANTKSMDKLTYYFKRRTNNVPDATKLKEQFRKIFQGPEVMPATTPKSYTYPIFKTIFDNKPLYTSLFGNLDETDAKAVFIDLVGQDPPITTPPTPNTFSSLYDFIKIR